MTAHNKNTKDLEFRSSDDIRDINIILLKVCKTMHKRLIRDKLKHGKKCGNLVTFVFEK